MCLARFKESRTAWINAHGDISLRSEGDPLWQIQGAIDKFNLNQDHLLHTSEKKKFNKSMSVWKPRTSATGNFAHFSKVDRKPRGVGTEFKNVAGKYLVLIF